MVTKVNPKAAVKAAPVAVKQEAQKSNLKRVNFKISATPYTVVIPENFSFAQHKTLKRKNFATDELYYLHRATEMTFKADAFKTKATEAKSLGANRATHGKAKRLVRLQDKIAELKAQLTEQGIDVDALLAVKPD
jgi:hypothetical protein